MLFTTTNLINYFTGKYIPVNFVILICIIIYCYVIYTWFNDIKEINYVLLTILIILLIVDIAVIICIFSSSFVNSSSNSIKKYKHKKHYKTKNEINLEQIVPIKNEEILSLFTFNDDDKSIETFTNKL